MATIGTTEFLALADSIAAQWDLWLMYIESTSTGLRQGTQANITRILAYTDADQIDDLLDSFQRGDEMWVGSGKARRIFYPPHDAFTPAIESLKRHLKRRGSTTIAEYCANNSLRVAPEFAYLVKILAEKTLTPTNIYPPVTALGSFVHGGAFTAGSTVDTTQYGAGDGEVVVTGAPTGGAIGNYNVTMRKGDGTLQVYSVAIPAASPVGTTVAVGTPGTDRFIACTNVAIASGGTAGDAFDVQTVRDRALTL